MQRFYTGFKWWSSGEVQDMLVENGRVIARGPSLQVPADVPREDLRGQCLQPGFIDAHCHILPTGLDLFKLHLGHAECHADVMDLLSGRLCAEQNAWLMAVHYDQNRYGGIHITRDDLDKISAIRPIFLSHVNGHAGVANSAALLASGIDEFTGDPEGGAYLKDSSGRMNGVVLEAAYEHVLTSAPRPTKTQMVEAIMRAGKLMRSQGIACASDMMTGSFDLEDELECYELAARQGCPIHMRLYVQWNEVFGPHARPDALDRVRAAMLPGIEVAGTGPKDVRVAGIKIFADGAVSSGTAAIYGRFLGERPPGFVRQERRPDGIVAEVDGQLMHSPADLNRMVQTAHDAGFSIAIHSIGDYSTDLVIDALERTGEPARHRIEHVMLLSDRQIAKLAALQIHCTMQPEFLACLGTSYRRQLGNERASMIIRSRSLIDAGVDLSFSSDRPIVAGDPLDGIKAAWQRPEGYDSRENCTWNEAVTAYTRGGANANREAGLMGSLDPGTLADFQTFEENPRLQAAQ